jgi:predicted nucleic acid-binding protein
MVSYVLDTVTLSELRKDPPRESVVRFIDEIPNDRLFLSVITIGEIANGIDRMPFGNRRTAFLEWLREIQMLFSGNILPIDEAIAERWGRIDAAVRRKGGKLDVPDGLIAATAMAHNLTVVTRNVKDFEPTGVPIINPWLDGDDN